VDGLTALKPNLKISVRTSCLEILVDIAVELVRLRMLVDLFLLQGNEGDGHVQ
jgi:hypothetical protein